MNSAESSRGPVSDSRRPPVKVGDPCSYSWRDMPNEILIPLQSLVSCFLESPANRRVAVGTTEGLWRGYSSACPKGAISWAPVAVTQAGGGSSVLTLLYAKDQTNENWALVRYLANLPAGYEADSLARFPYCFFLLSFSSLSWDLSPTKAQDAQLQGLKKLRLWCLIAKIQWETKG